MQPLRASLLLILFVAAPFVPGLAAQEVDPAVTGKLVVATKHSPPFAFQSEDGEWTGISIELWKQVATELDLEFEFREMTLDAMLSGLESGRLDVAVAAISVTAERHQRIDFCHPHFTTGLGIAVSATEHAGGWSPLRSIVSGGLLSLVGAMIGVVLVCGVLFWFVERKRNEGMFGGRRRTGIGMGVWWSTILLLGHKGVVPVSSWGRLLAASAMISSIFLLSTLTGVIASVLTIRQLDTGISQPNDLHRVRVVTVASSTSADYLRRRRIAFQVRPTAEAALQSMVAGKADAIVYDEALLRYLANTDFAETVQVLPMSFNTQEYAIALRPGSPLRKALNQALLAFRASDRWDELIYQYLGR